MKLRAARALLPDGWADDVELSIGDDGAIASVVRGVRSPAGEPLAGPVVPGMPNVHSHAFQRAIAGATGVIASEGSDSFWSWREAMYAFVARADAEALHAIAAQAYVEMVKAGYTSVAEFHYVHHNPNGARHADPAELSMRVIGAAAQAGIALTLLPVLYARSGFGGTAPSPLQRRFVHVPEAFASLIESLAPRASAAGVRLGVAPHSLRAVTPDELAQAVACAPPGAPIHIHAAEQRREVEECLAWSGQRPVEWLLDHADVDARWCVVHATHMTWDETRRLAASGATAGLAPTTEADLGDGIFPGAEFVAAGGRFGVGSDSNTAIDPFAELRLLEWTQRLRLGTRNVLGGVAAHGTLGTRLWGHAARAGARAVGRHAGEIAPGARADLVVLDPDDDALAVAPRDAVLDAAIFGPARRPVRDVMVGGRWVVREGRHAGEAAIAQRFRETLARSGR